MKKPFSTFDIKQILGLTIDRQKDWLTRGFIEPSIQVAQGKGSKNLFSREDLYLIALFQNLVNQGFAREVASARIKTIKFLHRLAGEAHRIQPSKLNASDLARIRKEWARLDDINFMVVCWTAEEDIEAATVNFPTAVSALRSADSENMDLLGISLSEYANVDNIILVNFKKIRTKVDMAIEK